jgi:hypothetical protein
MFVITTGGLLSHRWLLVQPVVISCPSVLWLIFIDEYAYAKGLNCVYLIKKPIVSMSRLKINVKLTHPTVSK